MQVAFPSGVQARSTGSHVTEVARSIRSMVRHAFEVYAKASVRCSSVALHGSVVGSGVVGSAGTCVPRTPHISVWPWPKTFFITYPVMPSTFCSSRVSTRTICLVDQSLASRLSPQSR